MSPCAIPTLPTQVRIPASPNILGISILAMWSYIQHQRIRKQVKEEYEKKKHAIGDRDIKSNAGKEQGEEHHINPDDGIEQQEESPRGVERSEGDSSRTQDNTSTSQNQGEQRRGVRRKSEGHDQTSLVKQDTSSSKMSTEERVSTHSMKSNDQQDSKHQDVERGSNHSNNKDSDPYTVGSTDDDDPFNPKNWPLLDRCKNIAILTLLIFVQAWAGSSVSMANLTISKEFHVSQVAENMSTAMYLFGIGSGSLFVGPLSETVGRNPTYLGGTFCYLLFVLGCALAPNFGAQIVCRYFVGLCASATLAINGGSVRDQFRPVKRSGVFPVIAWANVAGTFFSSLGIDLR